jgi:hypothetical protein
MQFWNAEQSGGDGIPARRSQSTLLAMMTELSNPKTVKKRRRRRGLRGEDVY